MKIIRIKTLIALYTKGVTLINSKKDQLIFSSYIQTKVKGKMEKMD